MFALNSDFIRGEKTPKDNKDDVLHWHVCNRKSATFPQHSLHWSAFKFNDILYVGDNLSQTRGPMPFFLLAMAT